MQLPKEKRTMMYKSLIEHDRLSNTNPTETIQDKLLRCYRKGDSSSSTSSTGRVTSLNDTFQLPLTVCRYISSKPMIYAFYINLVFIANKVPYKTIPGIIDLKNIVVQIERLVTSKYIYLP